MKYLKLEVTKEAVTDLYVEVPDDFDDKTIMRGVHRKELGQIARDTTDSFDWDEHGWEESLEVHGVAVVDEKEAKQFRVGTLRGV